MNPMKEIQWKMRLDDAPCTRKIHHKRRQEKDKVCPAEEWVQWYKMMWSREERKRRGRSGNEIISHWLHEMKKPSCEYLCTCPDYNEERERERDGGMSGETRPTFVVCPAVASIRRLQISLFSIIRTKRE